MHPNIQGSIIRRINEHTEKVILNVMQGLNHDSRLQQKYGEEALQKLRNKLANRRSLNGKEDTKA